jgi:hypothetical protein
MLFQDAKQGSIRQLIVERDNCFRVALLHADVTPLLTDEQESHTFKKTQKIFSR